MADEQQQQNKIDDYLLISVIGTGKTAQIWEVMHEQSGHMFAMKLLLPEAMADAEEKAFLKHEAKVAEQLEHPNLIRAHGLVMRKTECYFLMELFKTPNLKQFIFSDRPGVLERFRKLVEGTCAGLGYMHDKGWVHKDIKPDNILLNRAGEIRIIDFSLAVRKAGGLAMLMGGSKKAAIRGTRTYLAPETIRKEPSTPATDIYSLGVTFYEALTGTPPFKGDTPQDLLRKHIAAPCPEPSLLNPDVTPEMDQFILKMVAKKPKDRFQSMQDVLTAFANLQVFKQADPDDEEKRKADEAARIAAGQKTADELELEELMRERRDSRTDARIREMLAANPRLHTTFKELQIKQKEAEERRQAELKRRADRLGSEQSAAAEKKAAKPKPKPAAPQQAPQPVAPAYYPPPQIPPGYPPGYPQMPPGYPPQMPGYPPGYPQMPGAPMPGMPMPPGYPQQFPGMPAPGMPQPMPPQNVPQQPAPGQQPQPQQPAPQKPAAAPPQTPPQKSDDDLEFMTELPDIE
ncbi:protein kinase [bacterium]|nr:protein kinase [bacterium]